MTLHPYYSNSGRNLIYEYLDSLPMDEQIDGYTVLKYLKNEERGVEKMSGFLAELLEKEVKKGVQEGIEKQLPIEVEKELEKKLSIEVEKELRKELQKDRNEIAVSKIRKMLELGYSKEDILKLDYTNEEYDLALKKHK